MTSDLSFGRFVKVRRRALDLTQEDLAQQVGYSVITIRKIEADERRPSRQLAERLAQCLGIVPEDQPAFVLLARSHPGDTQSQLLQRVATDHPWRPELRPPTNLSTPLTRLIGRQHEVRAVREILLDREIRLITLAGPPGIGKSRLGIAVATAVQHAFPDGVFFVPLASINDPMLVPPTIADALGIKGSTGQPHTPTLIDFLHDRRVLLVLDSFEHMLDAATLVSDVLTACAGLKVLVTSRAPLHVRGEHLFQVPPLPLPDRTPDLTAEAALGSPAVELFLERAQETIPDFALTDANAADIARICSDLDGLPLAIELVAARTRLLSPREIVARLGHRLALLTDGPRDLPVRQQTVRRTIDWSYDLLDPGEQILFARLALFIGGCTAEAAEAVANAHDDLPMPVLDGLAALADKNLLGQEERIDGERYFVFLETIREYALERLAERGEDEAIRELYDAFYLSLAENANKHISDNQEQQTWLDRLEAVQDNLRAVLECYIQNEAAEPGLRLCAALWKFWHIRSHQTEGRRWIALILQLTSLGKDHLPAVPAVPANDHVKAQVLQGGGWLALDQGAYDRAHDYFAESRGTFRALSDSYGVAEALHGVGIIMQATGREEDAAAAFHESLDLYRELGDDEGIAWSLDHLGCAALDRHDYEGARTMLEQSQAIFRRLRHPWGCAISLHHQGLLALARLEPSRARDCFRDSLAFFEGLTNGWGMATSFEHLGYTALTMNDYPQAAEHFHRSLRLSHSVQDRDGFARSLAGLASLAVAEGHLERAARFFGAAEATADASGIRMNPVAHFIYQRDVAAVRDELSEHAATTAWSAGREMPVNQVMTMALAEF